MFWARRSGLSIRIIVERRRAPGAEGPWGLCRRHPQRQVEPAGPMGIAQSAPVTKSAGPYWTGWAEEYIADVAGAAAVGSSVAREVGSTPVRL